MTHTLEDIWQRRIRNLQEKTWNGDDPRCGFDFSNGILSHLRYDQKNWNDLTIRDFRQLLAGIPDEITPEGFTFLTNGTGVQLDTLIRTEGPNPVRIDVTQIEDQTYCILHAVGIGVYSVSWYKSRGTIDSIVNLEYGAPITLEHLTDLLVAMNLEAPYDKQDI